MTRATRRSRPQRIAFGRRPLLLAASIITPSNERSPTIATAPAPSSMAVGVVGAGMTLSLPPIGLRTSRNDDPEGRIATVGAPERLDGTDGEGIDRERRLTDPEDGPW